MKIRKSNQARRALELGINVLLLKMCFLQDIGLAKIGRKEEKCITQRKKKQKKKKEKKNNNKASLYVKLGN